jgi:hypothetical protein
MKTKPKKVNWKGNSKILRIKTESRRGTKIRAIFVRKPNSTCKWIALRFRGYINHPYLPAWMVRQLP